MSRAEKCILTNMCMIENGKQVLVQNCLNPNWPSITFPGGHVESTESLVDAVIREIKEETGLTLHQVQLCGIKQFYLADKATRYLVFLYRSNDFSGEIQSSKEGEVFWLNREELMQQLLAEGFDTMLPIFENPAFTENFHYQVDGQWKIENKYKQKWTFDVDKQRSTFIFLRLGFVDFCINSVF